MTLQGSTNYEKATDALDQAWDAITNPPGQAQDAEENRIPWATTALGIGIGHALLALADALNARE